MSEPTVPLLPCTLALRIVRGALMECVSRLEGLARDRSRRAASKIPGRERQAADARAELALIQALQGERPRGSLRADVVALLAAWALQDSGSISALEDLLEAIAHPCAEALVGVKSTRVAQAARLLCEHADRIATTQYDPE